MNQPTTAIAADRPSLDASGLLVKSERNMESNSVWAEQPYHIGGAPVKDASAPMQAALIKLLSEVQYPCGRLALIGPGDKRPAEPYLILSRHITTAWSSAAFDGQEHEFELKLFTKSGDADPGEKIAAAIISHLDNADFDIPGHALLDYQFESSVTRYIEATRSYSTTLYFTGLTVRD